MSKRNPVLILTGVLLMLVVAGVTLFVPKCESFGGPTNGTLQTVAGVRVGASAVDLQADNSMPLSGGIEPGKASGQEGQLRAVAIVLAKGSQERLAIVACDVLAMTRDLLDPAVAEIERTTGIHADHILINSTHTHHAPGTVNVHHCKLDEVFSRRVQQGIVRAVQQANTNLSSQECQFSYHLGQASVGQNSRLLLSDHTIYWIGPRDDEVRPTGPFDPELQVLCFRNMDGAVRAVMFNHSTHTIGTLIPGYRSPSFYGLASQQIEAEQGGIVCFLQGAQGSTHNLTLSPEQCLDRVKVAVKDGMAEAQPQPVLRLAAIKTAFKFKVRKFDEAQEDRAVSYYCHKRVPAEADAFINVFREERRIIAPEQGKEHETCIQAMLVGDVAMVGVPGELFTGLGEEIKRRSPFRHTCVLGLANDWIGYIPDRVGFQLGGYQVWTGLHSYVERGTGERIVENALQLLEQLKNEPQGKQL